MATTQNSRSALLTGLIISLVLLLACAIGLIISFVGKNKLQDDLTSLERQYDSIVSRGELQSGQSFAYYSNLRSQPPYSTQSKVIDILLSEGQQTNTKLAGATVTSPVAARLAYDAAVANAATVVGEQGNVDRTNAVGTINSLIDRINQLKTDVATANAARVKAEGDVASATEQANQSAVANTQALADASKSQNTALQAAQDLTNENAVKIEGLSKTQAEAVARLNDALAESAAQNVQLQKALSTANAEREAAVAKAKTFNQPIEQILRNPDGQIVRAPSSDRVFINLGQGDHIAPGLTFEVFDQYAIPSVAQSKENQTLQGKASIEVVRVSPGTSECRVIRVTPGMAIKQGDVITNLVYSKSSPFKFYVHGRFNLDHRGQATDEDAGIVRRLITEWGGGVTQDLNNNTDFVVMGTEPVVPEKTSDDPAEIYNIDVAVKALDEYNQIRTRAQSLGIPILNQNRFLYLTGYYEQASR